mmetsp:Transcript_34979/g.60207  ORF Transcript_34979/g.60207 Transcript_34979/m.60207 type:complete len:214 (+) Transcript_34979:1250-1891(+)
MRRSVRRTASSKRPCGRMSVRVTWMLWFAYAWISCPRPSGPSRSFVRLPAQRVRSSLRTTASVRATSVARSSSCSWPSARRRPSPSPRRTTAWMCTPRCWVTESDRTRHSQSLASMNRSTSSGKLGTSTAYAASTRVLSSCSYSVARRRLIERSKSWARPGTTCSLTRSSTSLWARRMACLKSRSISTGSILRLATTRRRQRPPSSSHGRSRT